VKLFSERGDGARGSRVAHELEQPTTQAVVGLAAQRSFDDSIKAGNAGTGVGAAPGTQVVDAL
jgi:hypothetical protein